MTLLLLLGGGGGPAPVQELAGQIDVTFTVAGDLSALSVTQARLARESVEVLLAGTPDTRLARDSVEVLIQNPPPDARVARDSIEVLIQNPSPDAILARDSIEVLVGPCDPPVNDAFATAISLGLSSATSGSVTGTNCGATAQAEESAYVARAGLSVWYRWTPDNTGNLRLTLTPDPDTPFAGWIDVFSGSTVGGLTLVGSGLGTVQVRVLADTEYYVRVDGDTITDFGDFLLSWVYSSVSLPVRGFLGCGRHTVVVNGKGGYPRVGTLDGISQLAWSRVLDDTSTASVSIQVGGNASQACCNLLSSLEPWCHELQFFRDGQPVWEGPVQSVAESAPETVTVGARDVTSWLDVRIIHAYHDFTYGEDLALIAQALIEDGLLPDDPNILPWLAVTLAGQTGEREYQDPLDEVQYVGDAVRELARTGLDFTVLGRRIILAGEQIPAAPVGVLTDDHILGPYSSTKEGRYTATKWYVSGDGFIVAEGGTSGSYGLIERIASEGAILDEDSASANALSRLQATNPTPRIVDLSQGAHLAAHTPIPIDRLVPGALVGVALSGVCAPVSARLRLTSVSVSESQEDEAVVITLGPVGRGGQT